MLQYFNIPVLSTKSTKKKHNIIPGDPFSSANNSADDNPFDDPFSNPFDEGNNTKNDDNDFIYGSGNGGNRWAEPRLY